MAEELRFDIIGNDRSGTEAFSRFGGAVRDAGGKMDIAAKSALVLDEALKRQQTAARSSVDATLALAKADDILADAEHVLRDGALEAEFALKRETEAKKKSGEAAKKAAADNAGFAASLQKMADSAKKGGGPSWLGPALLAAPIAGSLAGVGAGAALGLGGAAVAGGGALAAYAAVAKPILTSTLTAAQAVNAAQSAYQATISAGVPKAQAQLALQTANKNAQLSYNAALAGGANPAKALAAYHLALAKNQNTYNAATSSGTFNAKAYATEQAAIAKAYANLSPAQIQLSKQLGDMSNAWQKVKASFTPLIASSLQPWLKGVTLAIGSLGLILKPMAPVVHDLGVQFATLMGSSTFKDFMAWIGKTGAIVDKSVGNAVMDFLTGMTFLLPQFTPLIKGAAAELTKWADAFVRWSASQKAADEITKFLGWFHTNGPVVGQLLKNVGLALKALLPGIGVGSIGMLNVVSQFFGLIAKLPPGLARPIAEVAGVLLTLNKLGVFSVGVKIAGAAAGWVKKLLGGASVDLGAAGMQRAGDTMVGAAAEMQRAANTMVGADVAGGKGATGVAGKGAAAGGALSFVSKGSIVAGGAAIAAGLLLKVREDLQSGFKGIVHDIPSMLSGATGILSMSASGWADIFDRKFNKPVAAQERKLGHDIAVIFDGMRKDVAPIWNTLWNNTIARGQRGLQDSDHYLGIFRHNTAVFFDQTRHDAASIWDSAWNILTGRTARGQHDNSSWLTALWRDTNSKLGGLRHDAASIWDSAWNWITGRTARGQHDHSSWMSFLWRDNNSKLGGLRSDAWGIWNSIWAGTVTRTWQGVTGVMRWVSTLPGRIISVFRGAGSWLYGVGQWAIDGLWNGAKSQISGITGFFSGFASGIVGIFKKIWGWFSPSKVMYEGGKSLMQGLMGGIRDHAHLAQNAASAVGHNVSAGVTQWAGVVHQALGMLGLSQGLAGRVLYQMQTESGGSQYAVNNWDINAQRGDPSRGLMQVIGSTFAAYHVAGTSGNIYDPLANIAAAINYARDVYGPSLGALGSGHGYAAGTMSAAPGWAWVGERGPELMHFRGGEQVVPAGAGRGGGATYVINVSPSPLARPADIGREVVGAIREHEKRAGKGWRTP